jgi:hypothetical protein
MEYLTDEQKISYSKKIPNGNIVKVKVGKYCAQSCPCQHWITITYADPSGKEMEISRFWWYPVIEKFLDTEGWMQIGNCNSKTVKRKGAPIAPLDKSYLCEYKWSC